MNRRKRRRNIDTELDQSKDNVKVRPKIFESSFFDAIMESSCDVGIPQHDVTAAANGASALDLEQYEDKRKSLERHYGVEIPLDSVHAASEILKFIYARNEAHRLPKVGVPQLLKEAATKLALCDSGEKDLDHYTFMLDRAFVESREVLKEKDLQMSGPPCVKEEFEEVKCALEAFRNRWPAPSKDHISVARHRYLETLCKDISGLLPEADASGNLDLVSKAIRDLYGSLSALLLTIDISFRRRRTVTSRIIAEVASSITGVPRNFFPAPFQLPVELLVQRLSRRLVGLDNQLRTITNAMSIQKPGSFHLYSFLLLGPPGHGKTALAEALAKEMFADRIVEYNVANFTEKDFVEQVCTCPLFDVDETDGIRDSGTQLISNCVIVFDNIDKASRAVFDIILQILHSGSYVDSVGRRIALSGILILFTSRVIFPSCGCPRVVWESSFKPPFKGLLKSVRKMQNPYCDCNFQECLTEVENRFKPGFFDYLDDVIVLPWLSVSLLMSIFRIQVRNAASLCKKKVVVYPSAAVFRYAWAKNFCEILEERGHVIKLFVEDLISRMCNVEDESVVCIDMLLGSNELSFKIQKLSDMTVVYDFKTFKESLRNSRIFYEIEKEQAKLIYKLSTTYFGCVELLDSKNEADLLNVPSALRELLTMVESLLNGPNDNYWREQVQHECFDRGVNIVHETGKRARYMSEVEAEFSKLRSKLVEQALPVQVVAKALLKSIDAYHGHCMDKPCQQATSFLVLGLRSMGSLLVNSLSNYFVADDGTKMLVEVDLSTCTSPNTFFSCTCRNEPGLLLTEAILMRPYSVIVFYNLELAHLSAFTNIISILDNGLLFDHDGTVLDFRKSVIIFISELGNKSIMAKLFEGPNGSENWDATIDKGPVGFRFEILNRVDEILLFNPFASDQLLHGARFPLKEGQHLVVHSPGITDVLLHLFSYGKRELDGEGKSEVYGNTTRAGDSRSKLELDIAYSRVLPIRKGLVKFDGTKCRRVFP